MRCEICNLPGQRHHWMHKGNGGDDSDINIIYLCCGHHTGPQGIHTIGRETFSRRHGLEGRLRKAKEYRWRG